MTSRNNQVRKNGRVIAWSASRSGGFGWLRNHEGGPDLFFHNSALASDDRPTVGREVTFETDFDEVRGKPKAVQVRLT
ncbi:cold shock domain-containing protein [Bradyrhizobium stylosanthis]|uniref:cold shock domain-containing protein n=1 Tax=Bradyrhizobium stylosanthis TaxID=1803665 RepID=UPI0009EF109D